MKKGGGPSRPSRDNGPRRDFGRPQGAPSFTSPNRSDDGVKRQLEAMNVKLDSLIRSIDLLVKPVKVLAPVKSEGKKLLEKKPKVVAKKKSVKK
jgi:hypothetical protein